MLIENAGYLQKRIQEFVQGGGPKIPRKPFMHLSRRGVGTEPI